MSLVVADVRAALAAALAGVLQGGGQISAYMLSAPTSPAIDIFPDQIDYDLTMGRGFDEWRWIVRALQGHTSDVGVQSKLDLMLAPAGSYSVKAKLETDKTLGGLVQNLHVVSCTGYRVYLPHSVSPLLGCEWTVETYASGV